MPLNSKQIEAAFMVAAGLKQAEIAARLGISVKTLQRWKDSEEFQQAMFDTKAKATEIVLKQTASDNAKKQEEYLACVQIYKNQYESIGSALVEMSLISLRLGLDAIARLDPADVGVRQIESLARTATLCAGLGLKLKSEFIHQAKAENPSTDNYFGDDPQLLIEEHRKLLASLEEVDGDRLPKTF